MTSTLRYQLADAGFPAGGFAHSGGLEALRQLGRLSGEAALAVRLSELVWHTALGGLPFLDAAHGGDAVAADRACDGFLANHVAQRASRAQGRAFLLAAEAMLELPAVTALRDALPHAHLAVGFGAALAAAGLALDDARELFLWGAARGAMSAAVRLGAIGPLRAQAVLRGLHPAIAAALHDTRGLGVDDAAGASPWIDTAQAAHDRLYTRLFQS